jgi:peptide subunit release factor 1 (eRF1)
MLDSKKLEALKNNNLKLYEAIDVVQSKLKLYSVIPANGLIIFYGIVNIRDTHVTVDIDFEPFKTVQKNRCSFSNEFNIDSLQKLIEEENSHNFQLEKLDDEKNFLNYLYRNFGDGNNENRMCRGINEIIKSIQGYAVEHIVVCEDLDLYKVTFKHNIKRNSLKTVYLPFEQIETAVISNLKVSFLNFKYLSFHFFILQKKGDYVLIEQILLLEWLVDNYKHYNIDLKIISNENQEKNFFAEKYNKIACIYLY